MVFDEALLQRIRGVKLKNILELGTKISNF